MGRPGNATDRAPLSVVDILDVARTCFARQGYTGTSLGDVSDALGVTRQAIYYYFPAKHDILVALFERFFEQLEARVEGAANAAEDALDRFEAMYKAHLVTVAGSPEDSTIFTREDVHLNAEARRRIQNRRRQYNDRFVRAYADGVDEGRFLEIDPDEAIALLFGAANWTFRWFRPDGAQATRDLADRATAMLASGFVVRD